MSILIPEAHPIKNVPLHGVQDIKVSRRVFSAQGCYFVVLLFAALCECVWGLGQILRVLKNETTAQVTRSNGMGPSLLQKVVVEEFCAVFQWPFVA